LTVDDPVGFPGNERLWQGTSGLRKRRERGLHSLLSDEHG
jgi:hypothetical protein